jgi:hypothetical protein
LLPAWHHDVRSREADEFRRLCSAAFDLRRALFLPDRSVDGLKALLHLACRGVLGDRTVDVRRLLTEIEWITEATPSSADEQNWAARVVVATLDALLRIVRKRGWSDLEKAADRVKQLREEQRRFEAQYLEEKNGIRQAAALELVALYHLAKSVGLLAHYVGTGEPSSALDEIDLHFHRATRAADSARIVELSLLLRWMRAMAKALARATIWHQLAAYNSRLTQFKKALADPSRRRPLFDLLPPQREAIQDVMNVGNRAVVVELPTSSGKTLLAEFRILQTKVNVPDSWIAYLVPTRALVNQITLRLRRDLGPIGISIEQATPALEVDIFEDEILSRPDTFDVLVTTPEKLDLLYRSGELAKARRPLGLVIADEAHNLGDGDRGLRMELLLAMLNREEPDAHFLLLTPFVPNADELAKWLDDERSASIQPRLSVDWQPNERLVGLVFPKGKGRQWGLFVRSLHTSKPSIQLETTEQLSPVSDKQIPVSRARQSKNRVAALAASALADRRATIVLAYSPRDAWAIARDIAASIDRDVPSSSRLELVRKFVAAELGPEFELDRMLRLGVGVHHAGIPPEIRYLLEWLMDAGDLRVLVATTTLAQGVNFPISGVVFATHYKVLSMGRGRYAKAPLSGEEFWNIAGRAGRVFQDTLGLILFASQTERDDCLEKYARTKVSELASTLEQMVEDVISLGWELDLKRLVRNDARWSSFVQFLCHTYSSVSDHARFVADAEILLRRTLAYRRLETRRPDVAEQLVEAVRDYAANLQSLPGGVANLVDLTGFSPETVVELLRDRSVYALSPQQWSASELFRADGGVLATLVGKMLSIPELGIEAPRGEGSDSLAQVLRLWVGGRSIREIADSIFREDRELSERLTECCRLIFQRLAAPTSWGLAALQRLSGVDVDQLSEEQKEQFVTLPAMVYYGCDTVDGVLMRTLGVPRGVAVGMGEAFRRAHGATGGEETRLARARSWLREAGVEVWEEARLARHALSGRDYRNVWRVLNGEEPEL